VVWRYSDTEHRGPRCLLSPVPWLLVAAHLSLLTHLLDRQQIPTPPGRGSPLFATRGGPNKQIDNEPPIGTFSVFLMRDRQRLEQTATIRLP